MHRCDDGQMSASDRTVVLRHRSAFSMTIGAVVVSAGAVPWLAADDPRAVLRALPILLLLPTVAWALFGRPAVIVSDDGVALRNVTRTVEIPWSMITEIRTGFALTLDTDRGAYSAWAVQMPSIAGEAHRTRSAMQYQSAARPYDVVSRRGGGASASPGDVAGYLRRRWKASAGETRDSCTRAEGLRVRWHVGLTALVAALSALAGVGPRLL